MAWIHLLSQAESNFELRIIYELDGGETMFTPEILARIRGNYVLNMEGELMCHQDMLLFDVLARFLSDRRSFIWQSIKTCFV